MADENAPVVNEEVTDQTVSTPTVDENEDQDVELVLEDDRTSSASEEETTDDSETDQNEVEETEESETTEEEDEPKSKGEQRKEQLNTEIRDLVAQRNAIRQQVEQLNSQVYQVPTAEQIMEQVNPETGEYYNRIEAQMAAMQQERQVERYNNQVAEAQLTLTHEATKALNDFPELFEENSPYKDVVAQYDQMLQNSLQTDPRTGQIVGSTLSPYQLYQSLHASIQAASSVGQVKAQKAQAQMLANADTTQSAAPAKETVDPVTKILLQGL